MAWGDWERGNLLAKSDWVQASDSQHTWLASTISAVAAEYVPGRGHVDAFYMRSTDRIVASIKEWDKSVGFSRDLLIMKMEEIRKKSASLENDMILFLFGASRWLVVEVDK
jgi:hypothetical protein